MKENTIIKIALICIILGLPVLHFLSENTSIAQVSISNISQIQDNELIKTKGKIIRILNKEKFSIITLQESNYLDILVFDNITNFKKGDLINVIGKKETYKNKPEILAEIIKT